MAVSTPEARAACAGTLKPDSPGPYWYEIYGQLVESDIWLPLPGLAGPPPQPATWTVRRAELRDRAPLDRPVIRVPNGPMPVGLLEGMPYAFLIHRDATGAWWWWESLGIFHVTPDALVVEVCPEPDADPAALGLILAGPIAIFILYQLGFPTLHASAVVTDCGAVGFLGLAGYGKSTMAGAFMQRGARMLADDALTLRAEPDGIHASPGIPVMKVWRQTAEGTLGLNADALPNVTASVDKKLFWLDVHSGLAQRSARLERIYVLDRRAADDAREGLVSIRPLGSREGLTTLLAQISCGAFLRPAEVTRFLPILARLVGQTRISRLSFPTGFDRQDEVYARVLEDLR